MEPLFQVVESESSVGKGRCKIVVKAKDRLAFTNDNGKAARAVAEAYATANGEHNARMSSQSAAYPGADPGVTDNEIGAGATVTHWQMDFTFLAMP